MLIFATFLIIFRKFCGLKLVYIYIYRRVESKNDFLASSPIKRVLRMCYSEPLYEERKKQLNSTTNVSISEEISSGLLLTEIFSYDIGQRNFYVHVNI